MTLKEMAAIKELTDFIGEWSRKHELLVHDATLVRWTEGEADGLSVVATLIWTVEDGYGVSAE